MKYQVEEKGSNTITTFFIDDDKNVCINIDDNGINSFHTMPFKEFEKLYLLLKGDVNG